MDFDYDAPLKRVKGESAKSHSALMDYWTMGAGRSLQKLLDIYLQNLSNDPPTKPPTTKFNTLGTWSHKNSWQARIARQKEIDDAISLEKFRERHMGEAEVMARLADQARGDMATFADVRYPDDLKELAASPLVKKLTIIERQTKDGSEIVKTTIELYDAQKALELIGKDYGRFKDRLDITSGDEPFSIDDLFQARKEIDEYQNQDISKD